MKKQLFLVLGILILSISKLTAQQVYPVTGNVVMPFPSPIFLFDYYNAGSSKLQTTIKLNDYSVPSQKVKLKFTIENGTIELSTKNNYRPLVPISLSPGVPLTIQGSDLFDALNTNNLNFSGITAAFINANGGKLPEGQYNFCVEVLDFNTGKSLSLPACASVFLQLNQVPVLISPICEENLKPTNPQQIRFNWQTSGGLQPSILGFNTYKLSLYQITEPNIQDPLNAVMNSKAVKIFESNDLTVNYLDLNFSTVILVPGNKYIYRLKATGPNGKETFNNNGFTEWCWFNYGYQDGGSIITESPFNKQQFSKIDDKVFSWKVSDKGESGQPYDYQITIVELNDTAQDLADALLNNSIFHQETRPTTTEQDGGNFLLSKALVADMKYAWKIVAFSDGQKVAESAPSSFYSHSFIDHFYASNQKIKIIKLENRDLTNLSGKCRIQLSEDEQDFIDVDFFGIKLRDVSGQYVLTQGEILFDLSGKEEIELTPIFAGNGPAKFDYISGKINKTGLIINGKIKWKIPHSVLSGEEDEVITQASTFVMNSKGKLSGESAIEKFNTILMSPKDFELELKATSILQLVENEFAVNLIGSVTLPEKIKAKNNKQIKIAFKNQQNRLDYIEIDNLIGSVSSGLQPISNFGMEIIPIQGAIIDLSEAQSPDKLSADKSWKGIYFTKYKTRLHASGFDQSKQLTIPSRFDFNETTDGTPDRLWIDGTGLTFKSKFEIKDEVGVKFNSFQSDINGEFEIKKSILKKAKITGETKIPFLDNKNKFSFDILATEEGLEEGFLNQDLTELDLVYNPFGGENRMEITINRAVFEENERLSLNIDVKIPELNATLSGIEGFRIYGDYFIGVDGRNSTKALENFVIGKFKEVELKITDFGGAFLGGKYALSYLVESNLGEGVTGDDGPPKIVFNSLTKTDAELSAPGDAVEPELEIPADAEPNSSKMEPNEFFININTAIVEGSGRLIFTENDPEWGTKFEGGIDVTLKKPGEINMGANIILGMKNKMDYWYFDAYFEDKDGRGIPMGAFNMTAFEGKIYRNMKATADEDGNFSIELDPTITFGLAAYTQLFDSKSDGFNMQLDGGLEIEFKSSPGSNSIENVLARLSVDISVLNSNMRSGTSSGITKSVKKEVVKEITAFAIDQVFPQSFTLAGTDVKIDAKSLKEGSLEVGSYSGGSGFKIGGNVGSVPSFELGFATSGFKIGGSADASGTGNFEFGLGSVKMITTLENMNKGNFALKIGDFATTFGGDIAKKKANFSFDYKSSINLALNIDGSQKKGEFNIGVDGFAFNANTDILGKTAEIGFETDNDKFIMNFDGNDGAASLVAEISGLDMRSSFNSADKNGLFHLSTSSAEIDAEGSKSKAKFNVEAGSTKFGIESNFDSKTGKVNLEFPNNILRGGITTEEASVFLKNNSLEIGAEGKFDGSAGALHLKEGSSYLDLSADVTNSKGELKFGNASAAFTSLYNPSSESFIKYVSGSSIREARVSENLLKVYHKDSDNEFLIETNKDKGSGKFAYILSDFGFRGQFDPTQNLATTTLLLGDKTADAYFKNDSSIISYVNGQQNFIIKGVNGGSGSVMFDDKATGIATGFSYDKANTAGSLYYKNGDLTLDLDGNKTANTGKLIFENGSDKVEAIINDSLSFQSKFSGTEFYASKVDGDIKSSFVLDGANGQFLNLSNGKSLNLDLSGNKLLLSNLDNIYKGTFKNSEYDILALKTADKAEFSYVGSGIELKGVGNITSGNLTSGLLEFKTSGITFDVNADKENENGTLNYKDGDLSFNSVYNLSDTSFIVYKNGSDRQEIKLSDDYYKLYSKTSDVELLIEENVANESGKYAYIISDFGFRGEFDPTQNMATTTLLLGDKTASAYFKSDSSIINYENGQQTFLVKGVDGGSGSVKFDDEAAGIATGFSYDKTNTAGSMYYKKGDFEFDIEGNKSASTGKLIFKNAGDFFKGIINDSLFVSTKVGDAMFSAIKKTEKTGVSYKNTNTYIDAYKYKDGEALDFLLDNNQLSLSRNNSEYKGDYKNGNFSLTTLANDNLASFNIEDGSLKLDGEVDASKGVKFNYENNSNSLKFIGTDNEYDIAYKIKNWSAQIQESFKNNSALVGISNGSNGIKISNSTTKDFLQLKISDFTIEGGFESNESYLTSTYKGAEIAIKDNIDFKYGTTTVSLKNITKKKYEYTVTIDSDNYVVTPSKGSSCGIILKKNGTNVTLTNGDFTQAYGNKSIAMTPATGGNGQDMTLQFSDLIFKVQYSCSGAPKISIKKGGDVYSYEISKDEIELVAADYTLNYKDKKEVKVTNGTSFFMVSEDEMSFDIDNYKTKITETLFSVEKESNKILVTDKKLLVESGDKIFEVEEDAFKLQIATDYNIISSPKEIEVNAGDKTLVANETSFKIEEKKESFLAEFDANGDAKIKKGDNIFTASAIQVKFKNNNNHITVTENSLSSKYDDKEFNITAEKSVTYKDSDKEFEASEKELKLAYGDVSMEVLADKVKMDLGTNGTVEASENLIQYMNGSTTVKLDKPFESPSFSYDDGTNSMDLTKSGLEMKTGATDLKVDATKLTVTSGDNKLLLSEKDLDFKYNDYLAQFTDFGAVNLTNGTQSFVMDDTQVKLIYDENNSLISTPTAMDLKIQGNEFHIDDKKATLKSPSESFETELTETAVSITKDDYTFESKPEEIKLTNGGNKFVLTASSFTGKYEDKEFNITEDKAVTYKDSDKEFAATEKELKLAYGDVSMEVLADKVKMDLGTNGNIEASVNAIKYVNGSTNVILEKPFETPAFSYIDESNSLILAATGLELKIGDNEVIANSTKLFVKTGENNLLLTEDDLDFKYGKYLAKFTNWEEAFLSNGVQEFKVNQNELLAKLDEKNKVRTYLENNEAAIEFTVDGNDFEVTPNGAKFDYAGQHFEMSSDEYLRVHESGKQTTDGLYIDNTGLKYKSGDIALNLGSGENVIGLEYKDNSITYSKEGDLAYTIDGKYVTEINSDMSASFSDGSNTITLNKGEAMVAYTNTNDVEIALMKFESGQYGLKAGTTADYMFIKGAKDEDIAVGGDIGGSGLFEFSASKAKNLGIKYAKGASIIDLDIEKGEELKKLLIEIDGSQFFSYDPAADLLEDYDIKNVEKVEMNGPAHIGSIAEGAGGWGRVAANAQLSLGSKFKLTLNGRIKTGLSLPILCADASFGLELEPGRFYFALADPSDRASLSLICAGGLDNLLRADGYAMLEFKTANNTAKLDVDFELKFTAGFKASAGFHLGVKPLRCYIGFGLDISAYFEFGAAASLSIPTGPEGKADFDLSKAFVGFGASVDVYLSACAYKVSAGASLSGRLGMEALGSKTRYYGKCAGQVRFCGLKKGFDFDADFTF